MFAKDDDQRCEKCEGAELSNRYLEVKVDHIDPLSRHNDFFQ